MKRILFVLLAALPALVPIDAKAASDELYDYAATCKNDLGITGNLPALDCNNGERFAGGNGQGSNINDFVGYRRLTNYVDLVFACRWLSIGGAVFSGPGPFPQAASVELLIHNRQSGHTCFFESRSSDGVLLNRVSTAIVPPDAVQASNYWLRPTELNSLVPNPGSDAGHESTFRCVGCHAAGPYIASRNITPLLSKFGLMNDGHDIFNSRYSVVSSSPGGSAFSNWDSIKSSKLVGSSCASNCHALGTTNSSIAKLTLPITGAAGQNLVPSLTTDINNIITSNLMPIDNGTVGNFNSADYRWMNIDIPDDPGSTGDVELFYPLKANQLGLGARPSQALSCETEPAAMEARVVNSTAVQRTDGPMLPGAIPDVLEKFDQTGLICRNASQPSGKCANYTVRFICLQDQLSVYSHWTGRVMTIASPDSNQVRWAKGQPLTSAWYGSQTWHVESVNDGVHYDYVRFRNDWLGTYLNADISLSVATAALRTDWLSEQWVMEHVAGTRYVRFRNLWQPGYLTMVEDSDYSGINMQPLHVNASGTPDWLSQEWELK
jgi:mucin-like protein